MAMNVNRQEKAFGSLEKSTVPSTAEDSGIRCSEEAKKRSFNDENDIRGRNHGAKNAVEQNIDNGTMKTDNRAKSALEEGQLSGHGTGFITEPSKSSAKRSKVSDTSSKPTEPSEKAITNSTEPKKQSLLTYAEALMSRNSAGSVDTDRIITASPCPVVEKRILVRNFTTPEEVTHEKEVEKSEEVGNCDSAVFPPTREPEAEIGRQNSIGLNAVEDCTEYDGESSAMSEMFQKSGDTESGDSKLNKHVGNNADVENLSQSGITGGDVELEKREAAEEQNSQDGGENDASYEDKESNSSIMVKFNGRESVTQHEKFGAYAEVVLWAAGVGRSVFGTGTLEPSSLAVVEGDVAKSAASEHLQESRSEDWQVKTENAKKLHSSNYWNAKLKNQGQLVTLSATSSESESEISETREGPSYSSEISTFCDVVCASPQIPRLEAPHNSKELERKECSEGQKCQNGEGNDACNQNTKADLPVLVKSDWKELELSEDLGQAQSENSQTNLEAAGRHKKTTSVVQNPEPLPSIVDKPGKRRPTARVHPECKQIEIKFIQAKAIVQHLSDMFGICIQSPIQHVPKESEIALPSENDELQILRRQMQMRTRQREEVTLSQNVNILARSTISELKREKYYFENLHAGGVITRRSLDANGSDDEKFDKCLYETMEKKKSTFEETEKRWPAGEASKHAFSFVAVERCGEELRILKTSLISPQNLKETKIASVVSFSNLAHMTDMCRKLKMPFVNREKSSVSASLLQNFLSSSAVRAQYYVIACIREDDGEEVCNMAEKKGLTGVYMARRGISHLYSYVHRKPSSLLIDHLMSFSLMGTISERRLHEPGQLMKKAVCCTLAAITVLSSTLQKTFRQFCQVKGGPCFHDGLPGALLESPVCAAHQASTLQQESLSLKADDFFEKVSRIQTFLRTPIIHDAVKLTKSSALEANRNINTTLEIWMYQRIKLMRQSEIVEFVTVHFMTFSIANANEDSGCVKNTPMENQIFFTDMSPRTKCNDADSQIHTQKVIPGSQKQRTVQTQLQRTDTLSCCHEHRAVQQQAFHLSEGPAIIGLSQPPPRRRLPDVESDGRVSDVANDPPGQQSTYIPPGDHRREAYRLSTFETFPPPTAVNVTDLAKHGFSYTGFGDRVKCYSCGRTVEKWERGDSPAERRWHKPSCALTLGQATDNVPIMGMFTQTFNVSRPTSNSPASGTSQNFTGPVVNFANDVGERLSGGDTYRIQPGSELYIGPNATPGSARTSGSSQPRQWRMANVISADHRRYLVNLYLHRELDRLASFCRWPTGRPNVSAAALARSGFFYLGDMDRTQCFSCGGVLRNWTADDDAMEEHRTHFPTCRFVLGADQRNVPIPDRQETPQELSNAYPCRYPSNPHMRSEAARVETFDRRWPMNKTRATAAEIAEAGFFFLGERDRVKCWYCNGGLQNWEYEDTPWIEHAKWFPNCQFLLRRQGQLFIYRHLSLSPHLPRPIISRQEGSTVDPVDPGSSNSSRGQDVPPTTSGARAQPPTPPPTIIDPQEELRKRKERVEKEMKESSNVMIVMQMGYEEGTVRKTLEEQLESGPAADDDNIFDGMMSLLDAVQKKEEEIRMELEEEQATSIKNFIQPASMNFPSISSNYSVTGLSMMNTAPSVASQASGLANVSDFDRQEDSDDEAMDIYGSVVEGATCGVNAAQTSTKERPPHTAVNIPEDPKSIEEMLEQKKEEQLCKICFVERADMVFLPCSHMCCCRSCTEAIRQCPVCRKKIDKAIRTYLQ